MSRTRHPDERGTPLAWRRWLRRNVAYKHPSPRDARALVDVDEILFEVEELDSHDPEIWLHGTNLVTYADTRPKWRPCQPRIDYAEYDRYDPYDHYDREERWYWDEWYDIRDEWYHEVDRYRYDTWDDDVRYLDPREAAWVMAWLCGEVDAREESYDWEMDYWYDDCLANQDEVEGEAEFFASNDNQVTGPSDLAPVRAREKLRAGDRYYRTHRRAA